MKKGHASRKSKTHFEQIPLEVVKKIEEGDDSNHQKAGTDNSIVEPASRKSAPRAPGNGRERMNQ